MKTDSPESFKFDERSCKELFSNMIDGFALHKIILNKKGKPVDYTFIEVNSEFEKMTGLKRENLIGKRVTAAIPGIEKDPADWIGIYGLVALNGKKIRLENYAEPLKKWYRISVYSPKKGYFVTIFEDITDKRDHSTELLYQKRFMESLINMSQDISYIYDIINKKNVYCNDGIHRVLGYSVAEIKKMGDKLLSDVMHPDDWKRYLKEIIPKYAKAKDREIIPNEYRMKHKNGTWIWLECSEQIYLRQPNGSPQQVFGVIHDITDKKRAEEKIINSQKLLQRIIDILPIRVFWKDKDLKFLGCNDIFAKDAGKKSTNDLIGKNDFQMGWKEEAKAYRADDQKTLDSGKSKLNYEEQQTTSKGDKIWLKTSKMPLTDFQGNIIGVLGTYEDITEKKLYEDTLQSKTRLLEAQTNTNMDGILVIDKNNKRLLINRRFIELIHAPPSVLATDEDSKLIKHVMSLTKYPKQFLKRVTYLNSNPNETSKDELEFKNGMVLERFSAPVLDKDGKNYGRIWTFHDITDRKTVEEALRESNKKYKFLIDSMQEMAIILDKTGKITFANKFTLTTLGYTNEEVIGKSIISFLTKKSFKIAIYALTQEFLGKPQDEIEIEIKNKKNEIRNVLISGTSNPIYKDNKMVGILVSASDITDQKRAKEKLKDSEEKYRAILENSTDQIFMIDSNLRYISVGNSLAVSLNKKTEDMINKSLMDIFGKSDQEKKFIENIKNVLKNQESKIIEEEIILRGKKNFISTQLSPVKDMTGKTTAVLGIVRNNTESKNAEEKTRQEQNINDAIINSIPGAFYMIDKNGKYVRWNAYQRDEIMGKSENQIAKIKATDIIHPDDRKIVQSKIENVLQNGKIETVEGRVLLHGGPAFKWLLMTGQQIIIDGNPFLVGIGTDITERKKIEKELKASKDILQAKIDDLEIFHKIAIDRELKMIELKNKLKELEDKLIKK